jgi:hypothetical protein
MTMPEHIINMLKHAQGQYDAIQKHLLEKFSDEGNDIGDAGDILELISNTCDDTHDSYTPPEIAESIYLISEQGTYANDWDDQQTLEDILDVFDYASKTTPEQWETLRKECGL